MSDTPAILIVEDDELVRAFLCRALSDVAAVVDGCADGAAALSAVSRRHYQLILLDGLLPDMHGIDLGRRLLADPALSSTAMCLVSGSLRRAHPMRDGVAALPKPLRLRELLDAAEELLEWSRHGTAERVERMATLNVLAADLLVR